MFMFRRWNSHNRTRTSWTVDHESYWYCLVLIELGWEEEQHIARCTDFRCSNTVENTRLWCTKPNHYASLSQLAIWLDCCFQTAETPELFEHGKHVWPSSHRKESSSFVVYQSKLYRRYLIILQTSKADIRLGD